MGRNQYMRAETRHQFVRLHVKQAEGQKPQKLLFSFRLPRFGLNVRFSLRSETCEMLHRPCSVVIGWFADKRNKSLTLF